MVILFTNYFNRERWTFCSTFPTEQQAQDYCADFDIAPEEAFICDQADVPLMVKR